MKKIRKPCSKTCILLVFLIAGAGACKNHRFERAFAGIQPNLVIKRFEKELFSVDPSVIENHIPGWEKEYGLFFKHYCYILKLGDIHDPAFAERLREFVSNRYNYMLYNRTLQVFPDLDNLTFQLNDAFRHYAYYFPEKAIPRIYTYISDFNQSAIIDDSLLAIGLDKYLGRNEELYKQIGVYNYLTANMYPQKIASDCMLFWGETEFPFNDSVNNLVSNMIYKGRLLYFVSAMLPDHPDSLNWGFTTADLAYLKAAEKPMWSYLVENKLLFNTDRFSIDKYILEGPFTKDFGRGSPARAAVWIGYKITESYMKRNSNVTLVELMNEQNYMKILNESGYNP